MNGKSIGYATGEGLTKLGKLHDVPRLAGEDDNSYRERIRNSIMEHE